MKPRQYLYALIGFSLSIWIPVIQFGRDPSPELVRGVVVLLPLLSIPMWLGGVAVIRCAPREFPLALILLVGFGLRLSFFGTTPFFSDDVYRYLWDARVQAAGFSPYGVSPDDDSLDSVEAELPESERVRALVNHPEIPTVYPPVLRLSFRFARLFGGGLDDWRWLLLLFEVGLVGAVVGILRARQLDIRWVVLYVWNPLAIIENTWSAHAEIVAVSLACLGIAAFVQSRMLVSGVLLGLGGMAKLLPFGLGVYLLKKRAYRALAGLAIAAVVAVLPFLGTDWERAIAGLRTYSESWYFNDLIFRPLGTLLGLDPEDRTLDSTRYWRHALKVGWVLACIGLGLRARSILVVYFGIVLAFIALTPTLHPLYLLWLLPAAIWQRSVAALTLTVTVLSAYVSNSAYYEFGIWQELNSVRVLEFGLPALLIAFDWRRARASRPDLQTNGGS